MRASRNQKIGKAHITAHLNSMSARLVEQALSTLRLRDAPHCAARIHAFVSRRKNMCDLAKDKRRIDAILTWAMNQKPVRNSSDETELAGYGLVILRNYYSDTCPDECLRNRCEQFAIRMARSRRMQDACMIRVPASARHDRLDLNANRFQHLAPGGGNTRMAPDRTRS
jgi:hypothetical protein